MSLISAPFLADHQACDLLFADFETAIGNASYAKSLAILEEFTLAVERHFCAEEDLVFPAFEAETGMSCGPTAVMRAEHAQMRTLLAHIAAALKAEDSGKTHRLADTLFSLLQSHNMKEEQILYPMCDNSLAKRPDVVAAACVRLGAVA